MKILVIGGGISDEREISLRSSKSVYDAIGLQHAKQYYDWDGSDDWLLKNAKNFDVALPVLHGVGGEDGQIQKILEEAGIAYLGSDPVVSAICIDKIKTQAFLAERGVSVPQQDTVTISNYVSHQLAQHPHVLKPIMGGSSIDTFVLREGYLAQEKQQEVFAKHPELIIEECIIGPELTVPVLDGYDLPAIEIIPGNEFFDYETKYDGSSKEICNSKNIDQDVQTRVRQIARQAHDLLGCKHLSRVDVMLDENDEPYVIEVNTMPGLTDQSLFPKAAEYVGMNMGQLVDYFIELAAKSKITS